MAALPHPAPQLTLSPDDARLMMLQAQGLVGTEARRGGVPGMLRRLGAVQLDTISVLARSHELVAYARLGAVPRTRIERAYWSPGRAEAFEYWSHAACVLPIEEWPYYAFRRRAFAARGMRWHQVPEKVCGEVLARRPAVWPLLDQGELAAVDRVGGHLDQHLGRPGLRVRQLAAGDPRSRGWVADERSMSARHGSQFPRAGSSRRRSGRRTATSLAG